MATCEKAEMWMDLQVAGWLSPEEEQAWQSHLGQCASCRAKVRLTQSIANEISRLPAPPRAEAILPARPEPTAIPLRLHRRLKNPRGRAALNFPRPVKVAMGLAAGLLAWMVFQTPPWFHEKPRPSTAHSKGASHDLARTPLTWGASMNLLLLEEEDRMAVLDKRIQLEEAAYEASAETVMTCYLTPGAYR